MEVDPVTYDVTVKEKPEVDHLSESDVECLDETLSILTQCGRRYVAELARDAAWTVASENAILDVLEIARGDDDTHADVVAYIARDM